MKKRLIQLFFLFIFFFLLGFLGTYSLFDRAKREIISNNAMIVNQVLENHPELETEIIDALSNVSSTNDFSVLEKYGLTNLSSLDYLDSVAEMKKTFYIVYFVFFFFLMLVFFIYFWLNERRRKKEILQIDTYLFSLLSQNININLKDFQSGELATLQNDLMKVTSRLKNALESSTQAKKELPKTLEDISHQLKTPLTSLLIINDNLSSFTLDEKTRQEFLKKQEQIILHMKTLIITLLKVSQIESGMTPLKKEPVSIKKLFESVLEQLELQLVAKNIQVQMNIKDSYMILGDFTWLSEAILNIVKNACEHSYENGKIDVLVSENPLYLEVAITDYGEGISEKDLKHIFERFYKSSSDKESIGIGLNLTKTILERSNATISCKSEVGKYTTFLIHFYKSVV